MKILVTGGAGFIGSAVIRHLLHSTPHDVVNLDILTYAGDLRSLAQVAGSPRYSLERVDIADACAVAAVLAKHRPDAILHLAAESSVDRSIHRSSAFIQSNIVGTYVLLEQSLVYWKTLPSERREALRFLHVSTDEVYGDLGENDGVFTEGTAYNPSSPYAASKAASDHLVRAWSRTYGLPCLITHCSNNYGPYQLPEKLIPRMIANAMRGMELPLYGKGGQERDWLYVDDHVEALMLVLERGRPGRTYLIGGGNPVRNIDVVRRICALLEEFCPDKPAGVARYADLITHVADRPGHDWRYAVDIKRVRDELGWTPKKDFENGLRKTVRWYIDNREWWENPPARPERQSGALLKVIG